MKQINEQYFINNVILDKYSFCTIRVLWPLATPKTSYAHIIRYI